MRMGCFACRAALCLLRLGRLALRLGRCGNLDEMYFRFPRVIRPIGEHRVVLAALLILVVLGTVVKHRSQWAQSLL